MGLIKRIIEYGRQRNTLKYKLYKFLKKYSKVTAGSPVIIIWELGGYGDIMKKNAIISAALNVRGYRTHFIVCDGTPAACIQRGLERNEKLEDWALRCPNCLRVMKHVAVQYNAEYSLAGDYINDEKKKEFRELSDKIELDKIFHYKYLGVDVGMLAWSSVIRYMKGYVIEKKDLKKEDEVLLRKYFYAGLVNTCIADEVIKKFKPVSIFGSHGVYVDYSPPILLAYIKGIKALIWSSGFKDFLHYFTVPKKPNKLEFRGITEPEWKKRLGTPLSRKENKTLDDYIHHRFNKGNKRDFLNVTLPESAQDLKKKLGFANDNKIACLFCHVSWDLSFDLSVMIFDNANQWLTESLNAIFEIKDVNWIIRVHPGEKVSGSLYTNDDFIKENFKNIPDNVRILWSDSEINSLGLYNLIDIGITLFGTMGAELPILGKPVISGGEAHFSNKGFTIDARSKAEYFGLLKNIGSIMPPEKKQIEIARQYGYSYFIQRQIPINLINKEEGHFGNIDLKKIDHLKPGKDLIMEAICNSIIEGNDVILDERMVKEVEIDV
ncbi:MAG: hypothetical protein ABI462_03405 [Ignavibacteria bacterium]